MAEDTTGAVDDQTVTPLSPRDGVADATVKREPELPEDVHEAEVEESEHKIFGLPVDAFVKFGTTTTAHDNLMARRQAEEEQRRAEDDHDRALAKEKGLGAGDPSEVASEYNFQFTDHPEIMRAFVPLSYLSRGGREVEHEGIGDIIMPQDPVFKDELALLIFCPRCKERLPAAHCIITIRQSNRYWELDKRSAGELFIFDGKAYRSAGMVMDSEKFTCGRCSWQARIDKNKVWPQ